ncbi:MAG TPA: RNA polymerase sigma factor [Polyangia bacterium]|jgi:RNA polymerase sigma-70 factor (ECF subfamily)|nr:RNA polymerase sigma factor [Polyangia bacterium]
MTAVPAPKLPAASDDETLVAAARTGDHDAFAELFRRHADQVRARITRIVGPVAERDDLIQQTFLRLYQSLRDYRGACALPTFLHRITVTTALDHLRSARRRLTEPLPDEALDPLLAVEINETARAQAREDLRALFFALGQLSPKKRVAFLVVAVEGMSLTEAADVVGASAATVKQRVLAARRELVDLLAKAEVAHV